jgi:hypothetical protein
MLHEVKLNQLTKIMPRLYVALHFEMYLVGFDPFLYHVTIKERYMLFIVKI